RSNVGSRQDPIGIISAPLAGVLVEIKFAEGDTFSEGQAIFIVEAMKMQNEIQAPIAGKITSIRFKPGDRVESGDVVVEYDEVND
ncbi:MAG: acetyl-CoA carboxylase biotin carboxyl carrier protein subunit, partial [Dehalococcoidia bacterium]